MKLFIKILFIMLLASSAYGQVDDVEKLMTRKYISCADVNYNVQFLIPQYYKSGSKDTLNAIIDYWGKHCGNFETIARVRILLAIDDGNFNENIYGDNIIRYLTYYKNFSTTDRGSYYLYSGKFDLFRPDSLDLFTVSLAKKLLKRTNLTPVERFFLRFYSNDFDGTFAMLKSDDFAGTKIQELYFKEVKRYDVKFISHGNFRVGAWIPYGNLGHVGTHPLIGFAGGMKYKRLTADLSMAFKFGRSPNVYQVYVNDSIWNTNYFFGGYMGVDLGFDLLQLKRSSLSLLGGVAFDGFDALKVSDQNSNNNINKSLNSLNLNFGLGYKYSINKFNYLGLDIKYNFVDYRNPRGTDLSGNVFTVNLVYGFYGLYGGRYNFERLKQLEYK